MFRMVLKKLDNRIRVLIENGVGLGHRSMFVVVGDKGRDQVVILHHILSKATFKSRPSVLWCYKKELGFSSHRKKRMRQLQKKMKSGKMTANEDDPFELFIASTQIRYCYYSETHKILGNTYGMCVLQDFEALTPNLLARTIETVEGGGLVVILLRSMTSLYQLYTMAMDVHTRYRTEAHKDVVARFNERFLLSLASCKTCMVVDDRLNILPISSHVAELKALQPASKEQKSAQDVELQNLIDSLQDTQPIGVIIKNCKTLDQAKAVLKFIDVITSKSLSATVALTAARGRGKSAALGLAVAASIGFGYSNVFVTSPSPENLKTLFEFVFKGFDAMNYQEHIDYDLIQSTNPDFNKAIVRVNVFREHRQTIQYIHPTDAAKLGQAELLVIDEAAAIPLPMVRELLGPYLIFMASTVNGYEGTGRSLSLKLIQQLREQTASFGGKAIDKANESSLIAATGRSLHEITLEESIRYKLGDSVEAWLNRLLCLDIANISKVKKGVGCPSPKDCELYYVNRDTLFSFHATTEKFLQRMMSIYVAAHYKNSPNDLQMISDAPAHHLFVLLGPVDIKRMGSEMPEILCVIQVCLEGEISKATVIDSLSKGQRGSGDLIPWTISQQFQDNDFPSLSGARVVRIASHPDYQGMGYGSRALELLQQYYEGNITNLNEESTETNDGSKDWEEIPIVDKDAIALLSENPKPRVRLPPLLLRLSERKAERLDYLGVSYGLTYTLLKYWKRAGYIPVYLRQTASDLTGEHSCIMLKLLHQEGNMHLKADTNWLLAYYADFRRRLVNLLGYQFRNFRPSLGMTLLQQAHFEEINSPLTRSELAIYLSDHDLKRLEMYSQNLVDYHLIMDLLPTISSLYFLRRIDMELSVAQMAILLGVGLQRKTMEEMIKELEVPQAQALALFNRCIRKMVQLFNNICEKDIEEQLIGVGDQRVVMEPTKISLEDDIEEAARDYAKKEKKKGRDRLTGELDLSKYAIRGTEEDWAGALDEKSNNVVSIKSKLTKRPMTNGDIEGRNKTANEPKSKKHKKRRQ